MLGYLFKRNLGESGSSVLVLFGCLGTGGLDIFRIPGMKGIAALGGYHRAPNHRGSTNPSTSGRAFPTGDATLTEFPVELRVDYIRRGKLGSWGVRLVLRIFQRSRFGGSKTGFGKALQVIKDREVLYMILIISYLMLQPRRPNKEEG